MINLIKDFKNYLEYKKFIWIYQEIDFNTEIKNKLKALGNDDFNSFIEKVKNHITQRVMNEDLTKEFAKWASFTLGYIKSLTK